MQRLGRRCTSGLERKFSLFVIILLTAMTGTLTAVNIVAEHQLTEQRLRQRAEAVTAAVAELVRDDPSGGELRNAVRNLDIQADILYIHVLDDAGRVLFDGAPRGQLPPTIDDPLSRTARSPGEPLLVRDRQALHATQTVDLGSRGLRTIRLGLSTAEAERDLIASGWRNLTAGLWFLALGLLLSLSFVRRITRPLAQLTQSSEAVSKGQFHRQIAIETNDEIELLAAAFNRMLARLNQSMAQVRRLAYFDSVTDLPNRIYFRQLLGHALLEWRRYARRGAVLFLDLDRFKLINDSFGHDVGDRLLQAFARRLSACLRAADVVARADAAAPSSTVARLGGDEFTILLGEIAEPQDAARVAERVLAALDHPFDLGGQTVIVGTSIGIALFPDDGNDPETLLKHADGAMYHAKEQGRNNFQFYSSALGARTLERLTLERELRSALERGEFELFYQPQIDLVSGRVVGLEALLRWRHPRLGIVPPTTVLELAKETRLLVPVGTWVLRRACGDAQSWSEAGLGAPKVAVNLAAMQLLQDDFVDRLAEVLELSTLAPARLELEITETAVTNDTDVIAARLAALKELGIELALDDFGSGHSSLSSLIRFRLDRLIIDRTFVQHVTDDCDAATIVSAIAAMARSLKLDVAAAGVETEAQAEFLRRMGCKRVQGFLFSAPLPAADVPAWLAQAPREPLATSAQIAD